MNIRHWPLERKFLLGTLAIAITGIVVVSVILLVSGWANVRRDRIERAQILVNMIASNTAPAIVFNDEQVAQQILTGAGADPTTMLAEVFDAQGRVFARWPANAPSLARPAPDAPAVAITGRRLDAVAPIVMKGRAVGTAFVQIDLGRARERFVIYVWTVLGCVGLAIVVAFLLARYLQRWIAGPILSLSRTAQAVTERKDFSLRAEKQSADEVGALVDAFNVMLENIETSHAQISNHAAQLEKEVLARTAELRELVGELETFSYSVSHDLRAPLRAIVGFTEAALEPDVTPEERADFAGRALRSAARMDRLINDLLKYTRISKADISLAPVDLDRLLHDVIAEYFPLRPEEGEINVRGPLGPVLGDEASLAQVFSNLIGNALKFMPAGRRPVIEIWARSHGARKRIHVKDNGIGIRAEQRDRLFRIFERLHSSKYEGSGIGLSIVKKAVEKMSGTIEVTSEVDVGTTFSVELPVEEPQPAPRHSQRFTR